MKPYQIKGEILRHLRSLLTTDLHAYPRLNTKGFARIYFLSTNNAAASAYLRGQQLCQICSSVLETRQVEDIETISDNSIVIGTKGGLGLIAKATQNRPYEHVYYYYDPVDQLLSPTDIRLPDGFIASSYRQYSWLRKNTQKPVFLIPHHVDSRITQHVPLGTRYRAAYFGDEKNAFLTDTLKKYLDTFPIRSHSNTEWMAHLSEYPLHYCVRRKPEKSHAFNPATKLFIAAKVGAAVITTRDESDAEFLLPPDYPFYCHSRSEKSVLETLVFAQESFGTPVFAKAVADVGHTRGWRKEEQLQQVQQLLALTKI